MLNWISSQGWTLHLSLGHIVITKGDQVGHYRTIAACYFDLGGPTNSCTHNPKGLKL